MASIRRRGPTRLQLDPGPMSKVLSQLELVEPFRKKAVIELIGMECAPGCYRFEAIVSWRSGRWALTGIHGPRTFRSLDRLAKQLETLEAGRTVTRL
ncbi:hypothetical protein J7E70_33570 [Variovorax paradoxus]|nr:hypothetical protein [Variovorax paradoxus]MBT2305333.1 hypothetical protein [Variovorax paradoxus]